MWSIKTKVIPVIIGATGTIPKSFRKYRATYQESTKPMKYIKKQYWALHTNVNFGND
jgi:hypothetical protein